MRRLGSVVGRRVLITGASGGVGRFAVQLAARSGAHDSPVLDTVKQITGHAPRRFEQWARAHADAFG